MRCLWLEQGTLSTRDVPPPLRRDDEALIALRLAGLCSTDLELQRGYYPFTGIPGHEFVGEVLEAPAGSSLAGKRVVGEINAACGRCETCRAGRPGHCPERTVLGIVGRGGVFAELTTLPAKNLHLVPSSIPDEVAVFCEPLAAALRIQEQLPIGPGSRVLVVGAGRLGLLIAQTLALTGCHLEVVARRERPRALLIDSGLRAISSEEALGSKGCFDVVVEATGVPEGFELARGAVRPGGAIVMKSTYAGGKLELDSAALVVDEITLIGSRCGPFAPALRLLERGQVDPRPMIDGRYSLEEGARAFERAARPGALKVLIEPGRAEGERQ